MSDIFSNQIIKGVIFDFDGLIIDTESAIIQSWQELYDSLGCDFLLQDWLNQVGIVTADFNPLNDLEQQLGRSLDREAVSDYQRQREWELARQQPVLPGVLDYLQAARLAGLQIGLASSSPRWWVIGLLENAGLLQYFDVLRVVDDVHHAKPHPELYLSALSGLGLQANHAFALEDSPPGVQAARAAGLFVVAVPSQLTRLLSLEHANMQVESLAEFKFRDLLQHVASSLNHTAR